MISITTGMITHAIQKIMDELKKSLRNVIMKLPYPLTLNLPSGKYIKIQ